MMCFILFIEKYCVRGKHFHWLLVAFAPAVELRAPFVLGEHLSPTQTLLGGSKRIAARGIQFI
jgi:hypothetical protein